MLTITLEFRKYMHLKNRVLNLKKYLVIHFCLLYLISLRVAVSLKVNDEVLRVN